MITKEKNPLMADPFIPGICHCRFISFIMTSKNAGAAVFVINYISNGSAKLKAFEGMSFTHSYLFSSSIPTAQMLFMHLAESSLGVTHD